MVTLLILKKPKLSPSCRVNKKNRDSDEKLLRVGFTRLKFVVDQLNIYSFLFLICAGFESSVSSKNFNDGYM